MFVSNAIRNSQAHPLRASEKDFSDHRLEPLTYDFKSLEYI